MKSTYLSLAFLFLLTGSHAAPFPDTDIQEREPLPPVWCVWETNANGKGRHLDCSDPPEGPGIGDPFGPDGTGLGDLDGGYDPVTEDP